MLNSKAETAVGKLFSAILIAVLIAGCAVGGRVVDHSFAFNMNWDDQDAELLDYRYGNSKIHSASNPDALRQEGKSRQSAAIHGEMLIGDVLYAKWRNKGTGQVYEETVDLRGKLPADLTHRTIYFMIYGPQLYVYLISPERREADKPVVGPLKYRDRKMVLIFPDRSKQ